MNPNISLIRFEWRNMIKNAMLAKMRKNFFCAKLNVSLIIINITFLFVIAMKFRTFRRNRMCLKSLDKFRLDLRILKKISRVIMFKKVLWNESDHNIQWKKKYAISQILSQRFERLYFLGMRRKSWIC